MDLVSRKASYSSRRGRSVEGRMIPVEPDIAAELFPYQAGSTAIIFGGFGFLQWKIRRTNYLFEEIRKARKELKAAKNSVLSGEPDAKATQTRIENNLIELEAQRESAITFFSFPPLGIKMRIRLPQQDAEVQGPPQLTQIEIISDSAESSTIDPSVNYQGGASSNQPDVLTPNNVLGEPADSNRITKFTPTQVALLFVGVVVIGAQLSLLSLLAVDPMTSTGSNYRVPTEEMYTLPDGARFR